MGSKVISGLKVLNLCLGKRMAATQKLELGFYGVSWPFISRPLFQLACAFC